jgi:hypothetical protein
MANDPDDLVIRTLREIQGTLGEHTQRFDRVDANLTQIEQRLDEHSKEVRHRCTPVMPGLEPGIQGPGARSLWPWIAGSGPAMTGGNETPEG